MFGGTITDRSPRYPPTSCDSFQREAVWRWWLKPSELELYDLDATSNVGAFLSERAWDKVVRRSLNDEAWMPLTGNKLVYGSHYDDWGIPTPRSLGFLAPGRGFTRDAKPLGSVSDHSAPPSRSQRSAMGRAEHW